MTPAMDPPTIWLQGRTSPALNGPGPSGQNVQTNSDVTVVALIHRSGLRPVTWEPSFEWVLLAYQIQREPSTPRIAASRKLKCLDVVQIGADLVGLASKSRIADIEPAFDIVAFNWYFAYQLNS